MDKETDKETEPWRRAFRLGLAPQLGTAALRALEGALARNDRRLIHGATLIPAPLHCVAEWPVEKACVTAFCAWQGEGLRTVEEVNDRFAELCCGMDELLGEVGGCRHVLNFWDETEHAEAVALLLPEVRRVLQERGECANPDDDPTPSPDYEIGGG